MKNIVDCGVLSLNRFMMKTAFFLLRHTPYRLLRAAGGKAGMAISEKNYNMMVNMSFADFERTLSLMKTGGQQMPALPLPLTAALDTPEVRDARSLKDIAAKASRYVGVAADLGAQELDDPAVMALIARNFNSFTFTNSMKWNNQLQNGDTDYTAYDFAPVDRMLDELCAQGIRVRGHCLLWGKFVGMTFPIAVKKAVLASPDPKAKLKEIIDRRLTDALTHYKGRVRQWDVINETIPYNGEFRQDGFFYDVLGEEYIPYTLKKARELAPEVELYLNEAIGDFSKEKGKRYLAWLETLLAQGAPLDGIGIQGHVGRGQWDLEGFDAFAAGLEKLGLAFEITELDISAAPYRQNPAPLDSQAQMCYDIVKTALSHKNCRGLTFWGLSDRLNWYDSIQPYSNFAPNRPNPFDEALEKKPMYYAAKAAMLDAAGKE